MDYIELETIRNESQLTVTQAESLAKEINQSVWENLRNNLPATYKLT